MRCDVLAVGTELLLGQIVDTNSSWIGEQLAAHGISSHLQVKVGDNIERIVAALRARLEEADAVIMCGGLGPTHDDLTREAIAQVMGVELEFHDSIADVIRELFASRGRTMAENNLQQAMVPKGASIIAQTRGTAPGLMCPVLMNGKTKMVYAVPGVPHEMHDMMQRAILPDLVARSGVRAVIASKVLRTWGESESGLNERLDGAAQEILADTRHRLSELGGDLHRLSPKARLGVTREKLGQLGKRLRSAGFESILSRGYAIVRDADGIVITGHEAVTKGRKLRLKFGDGEADATGG